MTKSVARLPATAALWVRIQTSIKKYKKGDISKGVANTLKPNKKYISEILDISNNEEQGNLLLTLRDLCEIKMPFKSCLMLHGITLKNVLASYY